MARPGLSRPLATGAQAPEKAGKIMRYMVSKSVIWVIGRLWMPSVTGAQVLTLDPSEVDNARDDDGRITRESVEDWLDAHAGDFAEVIDFRASIETDGGTVDVPWRDEESDLIYAECMGDDADL